MKKKNKKSYFMEMKWDTNDDPFKLEKYKQGDVLGLKVTKKTKIKGTFTYILDFVKLK